MTLFTDTEHLDYSGIESTAIQELIDKLVQPDNPVGIKLSVPGERMAEMKEILAKCIADGCKFSIKRYPITITHSDNLTIQIAEESVQMFCTDGGKFIGDQPDKKGCGAKEHYDRIAEDDMKYAISTIERAMQRHEYAEKIEKLVQAQPEFFWRHRYTGIRHENGI